MSRRVLIVDDNAVTRKLVRITLSAADFEVVEASSAATAVAVAKAFPPDLVLQDMVLPDVDGFVLLELLRAVVGTQIPILAFTGLLSHAMEARMGTASFDDVISKPIDPARLRDIVRGYFPDAARSGAAFGADRRVVLADDDPVQRKLTSYRLSRMGFEVFPAADGAEALALAKSRRPDLIISDVLMPRMDGFELCSRVRADAMLASTPVVLLTNSYLEDGDFELAKRVGADGYVVRTPELTELEALLEKTLRAPTRRTITPRALAPEVQNDRIERALRQLDRQVALNATLTQRNAMLSAELTILGGLTGALAEHGDPDAALDTALSACFDAGGISWGVLLVRSAGSWSQRVIGLSAESLARAAPHFERAAEAAQVEHSPMPRQIVVEALEGTEAGSSKVLLAPIVHRDQVLGALLLGAGDGESEHRAAFAGVVAGQLALTLALGRTFRAYEQATAAERKRVRLLQSIFDAIEDPILVLDPSFQVTHSNQAAERLPDRPPDPRDWPASLSLYEPDQRKLFRWENLSVVRALRGESVARQEIVMLREGSPSWMSVNARPVLGDDGHIEGAVAVVRDVTAEKISQAQQMFSDRMATLGVLAAGVAHEINNPLSAVVAELDMALEDTVGQPVHEGLTLAREATDRVRAIVRDLKTLSRGETDEVAPCDLRRVIDAAVRMASAEIRSRAMILRELDETLPILGNEARLGQVFLNLLVNAAHAIVPGKVAQNRITLRTRNGTDGKVIAEVCDTGAGMSPEVRSRLFTPFFTTKPLGVGSGLGLSVSQRIVSSMGGSIEVETEPGAGTTFRLIFPAAEGAIERLTDTPPTRLKVLAVDEDPLVLQSIARSLRPDHDVVTMGDAAAALTELAGAPLDVVVWQLDLPGLGGLELRERMTHERPELARRVILLIGGPTARRRPAPAPCLEKPLDVQALRAVIAALG